MAISGFDYEFFINDLVEYVHGNISGFEEATADEVTAILDGLYPTLEPGEGAAQQFYTDYGMSLGLSPNEFFVQDEYILAAEAHRDAWVEDKMAANPFLTESAAMKQYDDLLNANPYEHYLTIGAALNVNPSNMFDSSDYLQSLIDGMDLGMTVEELLDLAISAGITPLDFFVDYPEYQTDYPALEVPEDEQVGVTPPDPTQSFELSGAATVDEGGTLTVTVTAAAAVDADTTFTYSLAGSGANVATAADFSSATSGTVKILAGQTTGTFTVGVAKGDSAEFAEDFTVTLKSGTTVVDTFTATINDTSTNDNIAPVATAAVVHYNENATATTVLATVAATDAVGVTGFEIVSGDSTTAPNFAIDATGKITFTEAGLTSTYNNADDTGSAASNSVTLGVKAVDAAGNKSEAVNIQLDVDDVDDTPPTIQSAVIVGNTVTVNFGETLDTASGSPTTTDFKVNVSTTGGSTGVNDITAVLVNSTSVTLTLANAAATGQTFKLDYTPGATPLQDKAGNDVVAFTGQAVVSDTVAPVITAGQTKAYVEGTNDDIADIVYKVEATDAASSIASFAIESGNTSGFYAIDNSGNITLTAAGLAGASNDYETTPNSFTLGIKATDAAGNASTQNVVINVTNDTTDDAATPLELFFKANTDTQEGKSGNDTFTGDSASVDPGDVIDGNEGIDTARIFLDIANESFTSREVEIMEVQGTGTAAAIGAAAAVTRTLTASNFTGVTTITNNASSFLPFGADATGSGNGTLTIADVPNLVTVGFKGGDGTDNYAVNFRSGVTTGELAVTANGGSIRNLMVGDLTGAQEFTSIKINSTGTTSNGINDILDGAGNAANNMTKLTVIGDKYLGITQTLENVTTIDASGASGGLGVVIDPTVGVNVTFTGSTGNDSVNIGSTGLSSSDVLTGGTGTDTLTINNINAQLTAVNSANIKEFETLNAVVTGAGTFASVQAAELVTIDIDNIITNNALTGITISGSSRGNVTDSGLDADFYTDLADTITINNINSGAVNNITVTLTDDTGDTATVADGAFLDTTTAQTDNVTLTGKGFLPGGTSDTATLNFNNYGTGGASIDGSGIDVNTLTFNNLDVLNIKSTGDATPAGVEQASIASLNASDTEKIVITGNQSFSLVTAATTNAITEIDASGLIGTTPGTYGLTLNTSAATSITSLLVRGTNDADNLNTSSEGTATSFITGAGSDVITLDTGSVSTLHYTTAAMGSGDMLGGTAVMVNGVLSNGDLVLNLASGVEAQLKSATTNLGAATANVNLASLIDANSNIAFFDAVDGDGDLVLDDFVVRIDLTGDGAFNAINDWQLVVVDGAASLSGVTYNFATDVFTFNTDLNLMAGGTANNDAMTGTAAADIIMGNGGNDAIYGAAGNDVVDGGAGDDTFVVVGAVAAIDYAVGAAAGTAAANFAGAVAAIENGQAASDVNTDRFNGGTGWDTLEVWGTANFTNATITSIENFAIHSTVTFTAAQLAGTWLTAVAGSTVNIVNPDTTVTTAVVPVANAGAYLDLTALQTIAAGGVVADTFAPVFSATTSVPADDSASASISANIVLQYNEPVTVANAAGITLLTAANTPIAAAVTASGNTIIINPTVDLANSTTYHVNVAAGAITDTAPVPNPAAAIADATTYNFTTVAAGGATTATVNVSIAGTNTGSDTVAETYVFAAGTYTYTINNFDPGDKLDFITGTVVNVVPDASDTDLSQTITVSDAATNATTTIILTGITSAQDAGLFNAGSIDTVFGAGTVI